MTVSNTRKPLGVPDVPFLDRLKSHRNSKDHGSISLVDRHILASQRYVVSFANKKSFHVHRRAYVMVFPGFLYVGVAGMFS